MATLLKLNKALPRAGELVEVLTAGGGVSPAQRHPASVALTHRKA